MVSLPEMSENPAYRWRNPDWLASVESWIREKAGEHGRVVTGPMTGVRFLPWSAVLRAPTDKGNVYFKACGPSQRHEPALAILLARAWPDCMIPVLAADVVRGWLLMPDGGETLTPSIQRPPGEIGHWSTVLKLMSEIQRRLIPRTDELFVLGVPDRRPAILPRHYESILARPDRLLAGESGALTGSDVDRLRALTNRVVEICAELATISPPDSYIHDDFHEDHIFATRRIDKSWRYVFFDYGDACISHPFIQLVSQPRFAANRFDIAEDATKSALREIYLAQWRDFANLPELNRAMGLALIAGCIIRALTWINACGDYLDQIPAPLRDAYRSRLAFWMLQIEKRIAILDAA